MQYILNETEYQAFQNLKEENAKLLFKIEGLHNTISIMSDASEIKTAQINDLESLVRQGKESIKERDARLNDLVAENQTYCNQIAEMKRDCEGTSQVLKKTQEISAERLALVNNLLKLVRHLKAEKVCVAQNPKTGTVKVISVVKADVYRHFGWTVSEEYLVDRPA